MLSEADAKKAVKIVDAVSRIDLTAHPQWSEVEALSDRTELDGVQVDPEAIIIRDGAFESEMTVSLGLTYRQGRRPPIETSDAMIGIFKGHFNSSGEPVIDEVSLDPSSVIT
jgi:hypothetical protein